ncbi:MAG: hypothetical protein P1U56_16720 [Saprospiraceae bacterium]|nr:hypothetical protein [Saprospiraceae bacterium]
MKAICTFLFLFIFLTSSKASIINWTGDGGTTNWTNPDNWDTDQVPTATDSVYTGYADNINIPVGYTAQVAFFKLLGNLDINPSAELIIDGEFEAKGDVTNWGTITISNSPGYGLLFSTQAADVEFHNYGLIDINNADDYGFRVSNGQQFTNHNIGEIEVTNSGSENFKVEGIFHNYGELTVKNSDIDIGILIEEGFSDIVFTNFACGHISLVDQIEMTADTLTNHGFLSQNYDGDNNINSGLSRLENYGVIEDRKSSFTSTDFDIQSVWINKYEGYEPKTGEEITIFAAAEQNGFTYSDLYTDNQLTEHAGTYSSNNIWIPNTNANGKSTFFVEITIDAENCSDTVRIDLEFPVLAVTYWTGGIGNWNLGLNWSTGIVPTENDIVSIYNNSDSLYILLFANVKAKQIISNGKISIGPLATLEIIGDDTYDGLEIFEGELLNEGTLQIKDCVMSLEMENSSFLNNGTITFNNTLTSMQLINTPFTNTGNVNLKNATTGISASNSTIHNQGSINCEDIYLGISISGSSDSLINNGFIENDAGDLIYTFSSTIINNNSMIGHNPTGTSIFSNDFQNYGSVEIYGESNQNSGLIGNIYNALNATIIAKNLNKGLNFSGDNYGVVQSDSCTTGIELEVNYINHSNAQTVATNSDIGILISNGQIINEENANMVCSYNEDYGLHFPSYTGFTTLTNNGFISIANTNGIALSCGEIITNQNNGEIVISNATSHGLYLYLDDGSFTNTGNSTLTINKTNGHGLFIDGGAFVNEEDASLELDSAMMTGLFVTEFGDFNIYFGSLTNSSSIVIGPAMIQDGIHIGPGTSLSNLECSGTIFNYSSIESNGTFTNSGVYHHLGTGVNAITQDIQNDGVIFDPLETISNSNIVNDGFYFDVKEGSYSEGETIINTIHYDDDISTGFEIDSTWYVDEQLTIEGGKYDLDQNTFFIYGLAADSSQFYFKVQNSSCTPSLLDTFSLHLEFPISKKCGQITWEGNTGSWTNPNKWNLYRLPSSCDSVLILNPLDSVLINTSDSIIVEHMYNEGLLFINSNGNLTIRNAAGNGILNKGKITNNGSLAIEEVDFNGYLGDQNSELINNGSFTIQNILKKGIILNNSVLQNKSAGSMMLKNITQEDFKLNPGSLFLLQGSIDIEE